MTFLPECGADRSFFHLSSRFIMILCTSDLLECEIQRLGASLTGHSSHNEQAVSQ